MRAKYGIWRCHTARQAVVAFQAGCPQLHLRHDRQKASLPEFVLDGTSFDNLAGFFAAITRTLMVTPWRTNLDALNDILRGGFGTPEG
jgi:hypothetical protein